MMTNVMSRTPLAALLLAATSVLCAAPVLAQGAKPLPIEAFFQKPAMGSPIVSPSGKKLAMLRPSASGRMSLAIADIATPDKFIGIAQFPDADVRSMQWVNDNRLVLDLIDFQSAIGEQKGAGLYAVNVDGTDFMMLIQREGEPVRSNVKEPLPARNQFVGTIRDGSDDVMIRRGIWNGEGQPVSSNLMRLNTRSLTVRNLYSGPLPDGVQEWTLDRNMQPRVVTTSDGKRVAKVFWREDGSGTWTELFSYNAIENLNVTTPVAVDKDGTLYVRALNPDSADQTMALYRYDVAAKKVDGKPIVSLPGFDFEGTVLFDSVTKEMLGASYEQETEGTVWFNKSMNAIQEAIDKQLPSTNNSIRCSNCLGHENLVVVASSDIQAPVYFLYNKAANKLKLLGQSMPQLKSTEMAGTQDFVRIKARDGMSIPVYVTKPKGAGPFPTIVMIHGGPYVRGNHWGFNPSNQFLASRGYVVIEPEFRGSTGYGSKLFRSGWKQWGLTMQDDMTDATKWAIAQGLADPKRIAIAGASYGGYATMMGLVKEPELYKVGINWVGVTDIELMYTIGWSDFMGADSPWMKYGMPVMIGDPSKDAAQLKATSPLQQAARIKQPVFMAYGEEDHRVPMPHGTKMRDALIASGNKNVEWVQYPGEGHGWMLTKNNVDFWGRFERFLDKHLK